MKSDIFSGNYLFHLHTTFTDGLITIPEYFEFAARNGVDRLIFLEHIRKNASYSVEDFINAVSGASHEYDVPYSIGFEAKILLDGTLDISSDQLYCADVIGIAEHGNFNDPAQLEESLTRAFQFYGSRFFKKHIVWVHPGLGLLKIEPASDRFRRLLDTAVLNHIGIERNIKHQSAWNELVLKNYSTITGLDSHEKADLHTWLNKFSTNKDKT